MSVFHAIIRIVVKHCSHFRFQPDRIQLPRVCYRLTVTCAPFSFFSALHNGSLLCIRWTVRVFIMIYKKRCKWCNILPICVYVTSLSRGEMAKLRVYVHFRGSIRMIVHRILYSIVISINMACFPFRIQLRKSSYDNTVSIVSIFRELISLLAGRFKHIVWSWWCGRNLRRRNAMFGGYMKLIFQD